MVDEMKPAETLATAKGSLTTIGRFSNDSTEIPSAANVSPMNR